MLPGRHRSWSPVLLLTLCLAETLWAVPQDRVQVRLQQGLPDAVAHVGKVFEYSLADHPVFGRSDAEIKVHSVRDGRPTAWLSYDAEAGGLVGVPTPQDQGDTYVSLSLTCSQPPQCNDVTDVFRVDVRPLSLSAPPPTPPTEPAPGEGEGGGCGEETAVASLVLCQDLGAMGAWDRVALASKLGAFLAVTSPGLLLLLPSDGQGLLAVDKGFQVLAAGAGSTADCGGGRYLEVAWHLSCPVLLHLRDFTAVLQHNIQVGRLEKEAGSPVAGWYVASSNSPASRKSRVRRQAGYYRTPYPTPSLAIPLPSLEAGRPQLGLTLGVRITPTATLGVAITDQRMTPEVEVRPSVVTQRPSWSWDSARYTWVWTTASSTEWVTVTTDPRPATTDQWTVRPTPVTLRPSWSWDSRQSSWVWTTETVTPSTTSHVTETVTPTPALPTETATRTTSAPTRRVTRPWWWWGTTSDQTEGVTTTSDTDWIYPAVTDTQDPIRPTRTDGAWQPSVSPGGEGTGGGFTLILEPDTDSPVTYRPATDGDGVFPDSGATYRPPWVTDSRTDTYTGRPGTLPPPYVTDRRTDTSPDRGSETYTGRPVTGVPSYVPGRGTDSYTDGGVTGPTPYLPDGRRTDTDSDRSTSVATPSLPDGRTDTYTDGPATRTPPYVTDRRTDTYTFRPVTVPPVYAPDTRVDADTDRSTTGTTPFLPDGRTDTYTDRPVTRTPPDVTGRGTDTYTDRPTTGTPPYETDRETDTDIFRPVTVPSVYAPDARTDIYTDRPATGTTPYLPDRRTDTYTDRPSTTGTPYLPDRRTDTYTDRPVTLPPPYTPARETDTYPERPTGGSSVSIPDGRTDTYTDRPGTASPSYGPDTRTEGFTDRPTTGRDGGTGRYTDRPATRRPPYVTDRRTDSYTARPTSGTPYVTDTGTQSPGYDRRTDFYTVRSSTSTSPRVTDWAGYTQHPPTTYGPGGVTDRRTDGSTGRPVTEPGIVPERRNDSFAERPGTAWPPRGTDSPSPSASPGGATPLYPGQGVTRPRPTDQPSSPYYGSGWSDISDTEEGGDDSESPGGGLSTSSSSSSVATGRGSGDLPTATPTPPLDTVQKVSPTRWSPDSQQTTHSQTPPTTSTDVAETGTTGQTSGGGWWWWSSETATDDTVSSTSSSSSSSSASYDDGTTRTVPTSDVSGGTRVTGRPWTDFPYGSSSTGSDVWLGPSTTSLLAPGVSDGDRYTSRPGVAGSSTTPWGSYVHPDSPSPSSPPPLESISAWTADPLGRGREFPQGAGDLEGSGSGGRSTDQEEGEDGGGSGSMAVTDLPTSPTPYPPLVSPSYYPSEVSPSSSVEDAMVSPGFVYPPFVPPGSGVTSSELLESSSPVDVTPSPHPSMYPPTPSGRPSHSSAPDEDPFYFVSNSDLVEPTITLQGSSVYPDHFSHVPGFATTPSGEPGSGGGPSTPHGGRDDEDLGGSGSGSGSGSGNLTEQEWTELTHPGVVLPSSAVEPSPSPALVPSLERGWGVPEHGSSGGSQGITPPASVFVPGSSDMPSSLPPTPGSGEVDRATGSGAVHPWDRDTASPDARVTAPGLGGSDVTDDAGNEGVTRDPWAWPPTRSNSGDGVTDDGWWWGSTPGPATDRPHGRSTPEVVTEEPFWFSTVRVGGEEAGLRPTTKGLPNSPPYRANPINVLVAELGRYFEFAIPDDTFGDREDGDTRRLSLSLALPYDQSLPPNFWLKLDPVHQELKGLPLAVDLDSNYHYVMLEARDAQGMVARDAIKLVVNSSNYVKFTHRFTLRLQVHFASFMADRDNLAQLLWKLATYVGDHSPMYMTVLEVKPGSLELSWSNNSYSGDDCHNASLARLLHRLVRRDGSPRTSLQRHLGPDLPLASVEFSPLGACLEGEATTLGASPLPPRPNEDSGLSIWAQVVLPVLIALLLLLFILLIVLLIYRRRRQQQKPPLQSWEKPAFNNDRNPIIFPDEVEGGDDPALRPKKPTLLPSDQPPASTATSTRPYYFEGEEPLPPQPTHSNTGSLDSRGRSSTGRRTPKPPPYCWAGGENDPPPYRLPPPYHKESSTDV